MMNRVAALLAMIVAGVAGCGPDAGGSRLQPPQPIAQIDRITLLSMPTAINLDNIPGPDGMRVQVYLFQLSRAQPVTVSGMLEFHLFEGKVSEGELRSRQPFHVWRYPPEELRGCLLRGMAGWGYAMELRWGDNAPKTRTVSLAARYIPPKGEAVYSEAAIIEVYR